MQLRPWQRLKIGLAALWCEENVILSPKDDRFRLPFFQKGLPSRIERNIRAIVIEQIELNPVCTWPIQKIVIHVPVIWADQLRGGMAVRVYGFDRVAFEKCTDSLFRFVSRNALLDGPSVTL
jgi:hypothetical protein